MRRVLKTAANRRAAVWLEFALIAPVIIAITFSLYDITNVVIAWWQLSSAADAIARIATNFAAQPDNTNCISITSASTTNTNPSPACAAVDINANADATTASTAIFGVLPALTTAPASSYSVSISSVVMTPTIPGCTSNCTYLAKTAWSATFQGVAAHRPCGLLASVPDGQPASITTLPKDAFSPAPLLVVDVTYNLAPFLTNLFGTSLRLMETAYMAPRTGPDSAWVRLTGQNYATAQCPGFTG